MNYVLILCLLRPSEQTTLLYVHIILLQMPGVGAGEAPDAGRGAAARVAAAPPAAPAARRGGGARAPRAPRARRAARARRAPRARQR